MTNKKRTQITIHTRQRIVVRPLHDSFVRHCDHCGDEALMLTPEKAAETLQTTLPETLRLLAAGTLHASETSTGLKLICCNSISAVSTFQTIQIEGELR
ncbi:MAG TPA: hypothetical protein VE961_00375 [Pyrinomonadaceae bacterium]|nr:hypothetical protein [Pyrinomonadaceae bacterium]